MNLSELRFHIPSSDQVIFCKPLLFFFLKIGFYPKPNVRDLIFFKNANAVFVEKSECSSKKSPFVTKSFSFVLYFFIKGGEEADPAELFKEQVCFA